MADNPELQNQRDGLPSWVWNLGLFVGIGILGHIGLKSSELLPIQVGAEAVLALLALTLAASARTDGKKNIAKVDWPASSPRGDEGRMTEYQIKID